MFENMMENLEEQSRAFNEKLSQIAIAGIAGNGMVEIKGNAAKEITGIKIAPELLQPQNAEELEDLLVVAFNTFMESAGIAEAQVADELMPGWEDLF